MKRYKKVFVIIQRNLKKRGALYIKAECLVILRKVIELPKYYWMLLELPRNEGRPAINDLFPEQSSDYWQDVKIPVSSSCSMLRNRRAFCMRMRQYGLLNVFFKVLRYFYDEILAVAL